MNEQEIFEYAGRSYTLNKHPAIVAKLRKGLLSVTDFATYPFYLRLSAKETPEKLSANPKDAVRRAKDILKARVQAPSDYQAYREQRRAAASITLGELAELWEKAEYAESKTTPRPVATAESYRKQLILCLPWWKTKPIESVNKSVIEDYVVHRQPHLGALDKDLTALSQLCEWAISADHIAANPFEKRRQYYQVKRHCHEACPDTDENLHRILAYLMDPTVRKPSILAAGNLAFCALTGLRSNEPLRLRRLPVMDKMPPNPKILLPGAIFPDAAGRLRMKVERSKNGQNPYLIIHPALNQFLAAWKAWLARFEPNAELLFPFPGCRQNINSLLARACAALELPRYIPHGFGRAFYAKVRRSQGDFDTEIGMQLGQTTNGQLIRSTYGDPCDLIGGALFDWLPEDAAPAWNLLAQYQNRPSATNAGGRPKKISQPQPQLTTATT